MIESLYRLDVAVFRAIHVGWHRVWLDPVFLVLTCFGDGWYQTALVFLTLASPVTRRYFWPLIASLVLGGIAGADLLKALITRERPSLLPFSHPQEAWKYNSFPSGHTTSAFAIAATLFLLTRATKHAWWGPASLVLAAFVGLSRIYRGVHWPSDVIGGVFCGVAFGAATYAVFIACGYSVEPSTPSERKRE